MEEKHAQPTDDFGDETDESNYWLSAWYDPLANLEVHQSSIEVVDVFRDGDYRFVAADESLKLREFRNTKEASSQELMGPPVAMRSFYAGKNGNRKPYLAVASGSVVYSYHCLNPKMSFTVPPTPAHDSEVEAWQLFKNDQKEFDNACTALNVARESGVILTGHSLDLLAIEDDKARLEFMKNHLGMPKVHETCITCMSVLKEDRDDEDAVGSLVLGTENGKVLILDPMATKVTSTLNVESAPMLLCVSGTAKVESRIIVACRDNVIRTIKNGQVTRITIELEVPAVGLVRNDRNIIVGCMDMAIHCFHFKGKRNWRLQFNKPITNVETFNPVQTTTKEGYMVALQGGEVRQYFGKVLVSVIQTGDTISAFRFGRYGREENTLIMVHCSGALSIKMLKRTANLDVVSRQKGAPKEQNQALNIPKKTKLYVEQTQRERNSATEMHRIFQMQLSRLRLTTAETYLKVLTDGKGDVSYPTENVVDNSQAQFRDREAKEQTPIKRSPGFDGRELTISAEVKGLGPYFNIHIGIRNTTSTIVLRHTYAMLQFDQDIYLLAKQVIPIPVLLPGTTHRFVVRVQCIDPNGAAGVIRMHVVEDHANVPLVTANITMPLSECVLD